MTPAGAKRVVIAYSLAVPVLIGIGLMQHRMVQNVGASQATIAQTGQVILALHAVTASLKSLEAEVEAGLTRGDTVNLGRILPQAANVRSSVEQVNLLLLNDPEPNAKFARLAALIRKRLETVEKAVEDMRQRRPAAAKTRLAEDGTLWTEIRAAAEEMTQEQVSRLQRRTDEVSRLSARAATTLGAGSIVAIWLVALAALLMHRHTVEKKWKGVERRVHTRILDTLPVGVCMMDSAGFVLYTNRKLDEVTGFKAEESVGRHFANLHTHPREERDRLIQEISDRLQLGGVWEGEFVGLRKGGKLYRCVVRAITTEIADKPHWVFLQEDLGPPETSRK